MKIVCLGEILGRLSPDGCNRFLQAQHYEMTYGGAEANVAAALSQMGKEAVYLTRLPDNDLGKAALRSLRAHGVDTGRIVFGGDRLGLYFLERGAALRPSRVIYDRAGSSFSQAKPEDFPLDSVFEGAGWFHLSGITPALSGNCALLALAAVRAAKKAGCTVSLDVNYRAKLWGIKEAGAMLSTLMPYVDVLITNEEHGQTLFGLSSRVEQPKNDAMSPAVCGDLAEQLEAKFGVSTVAITLRRTLSSDDNAIGLFLRRCGKTAFSEWGAIHMVDRVGGGDALTAGLIYALTEDFGNEETVRFALAASALKHTINGDFHETTVAEIRDAMRGDGARTKR